MSDYERYNFYVVRDSVIGPTTDRDAAEAVTEVVTNGGVTVTNGGVDVTHTE